jgi:thymidine phosphorylase
MSRLSMAARRLASNPDGVAALDEVIDSCVGSAPPDEELAELATILGRSGQVLNEAPADATDVASTGGPGSLTTILTPLQCCAAGWQVRKITVPGRPAGSVDVFSLIKGYRVDLDLREALEVLALSGYVQLVAAPPWAPLDGALFRRRQQRGMQPVIPLVIVSLLAKKVAAGLHSFALDIRAVPYGNFGATSDEASHNAVHLTQVAEKLAIKVVYRINDSRTPAQPYIGRGEALMALDALVGNADLHPWLANHAHECSELALLATGSATVITARELRRVLMRHLVAQGATEDAWLAAIASIQGHRRVEILADEHGIVSIDLAAVRSVIVDAQRAYSIRGGFADPCGIVISRAPGELVNRGDLLATVRLAVDGMDIVDRLRRALWTTREG